MVAVSQDLSRFDWIIYGKSRISFPEHITDIQRIFRLNNPNQLQFHYYGKKKTETMEAKLSQITVLLQIVERTNTIIIAHLTPLFEE